MKARKEEAEDIFARWLESVEKGDATPFAELRAQHSEHAQELERLFAEWEKFPALQPLAPGAHSDSDLFRGPQSLGDSKALLTHGKRIGRYELERELGRGGMGVVWLARDLVLGDPVALKFLPQVLTTDRIAMLRLRREAKVLLALTHTNIVRLRTIESSSGLTFLIEEFLAGPTLAELLEERLERHERGLACAEIRWLIEQLAPALEYAHGEGVTHRDLKPSNMMLDAELRGALGAGRERAKLTDFGLAFVANSALSQISSYRPSGTLPYMAPEVLMGGKPTPAADIYSLGVTVYCLVAGRPPFTHGDIAAQILHSRPERLESGDEHIDAAVRAALAKRPEDRPVSVLDFLAMLRGEKEAPSPSRRPLFVRLASGAATVLLAGAGWLGWRELSTREARSPQAAAPAENVEPARLPVTIQLEPPFVLGEKRVVVGQRGLELRGHITNARSREFDVILGGIRHRASVEPDGSFFLQPPLVSTTSNLKLEIEGAEPIEFQVELDADKPVLNLVEPRSSPWTTSEGHLAVKVRVEERNPASVRLGEILLEPVLGEEKKEEGLFLAPSIALQPGDNVLTVRARDRADNEATLTILVHQEQRAVTLASSDPAEGSQIHLGEPVPLTLSFRSPVASASFAGRPLTLGADARSATGELVANSSGTWRGTWSARDPAGREASGELVFAVAVRGRPPVVKGRTFEALDPEPRWDRWARRVRDPESKIVFRLVDPGEFRMGSRPLTARMDEEPWRDVRISQPYYLAEKEVTRGQWRSFVEGTGWQTSAERRGKASSRAPFDSGKAQERAGASWQNPEPDHSVPSDDNYPVSQVSWHDARAFCAHFGFRLPTEAEWEHACRAGSSAVYPWSDRADGLEQQANLADASLTKRFPGVPVGKMSDGHALTAPVGSFAANPWGFQDMLGNVWEWCEDAYDPSAYRVEELDPLAALVGGPPPSVVLDPAVTTSDAERPRGLRGGSWLTPPSEVRSARRAFDLPDRPSDTRGFRPAFTPESPVAPALLSPGTGRDPLPLILTVAHPGGARRLSLRCVRDEEGNLIAHGDYERHFPDGQVAERGEFDQGKRTNRWTEFHPGGKRRAQGSFGQDRRLRTWSFWHPDETLRAKGDYTLGWPAGRWEFTKADGSKDSLHTGTYVHVESSAGEGSTLDGKSHGWWTFRWEDWTKRFEGTYQGGQRSGAWCFWHPDGTYDSTMLSGTYELDERIALGDPPWLPAARDYACSPLRPIELRALLSLLGRDDDRTSKYAQRLESLCAGPAAEAEGLLDWLGQDGSAAMPALVRMLLELDLRDAAEVAKGQRLMDAMRQICNRRGFPWHETLALEDQDFNRLQVLRTTSLWLMTRNSPTYWELEIPAAGRSDDPVLATAEDPFLALFFQNPLLYAPPEYGQPSAASAPPRPVVLRDKRTLAAIESALVWLARHQAQDGSWDCDGFPGYCTKNQCGGIGSATHDVGVTGLALLTFLNGGNSALEGRHHQTVRRGLLWLIEQQDEDGLFGELLASAPHVPSPVRRQQQGQRASPPQDPPPQEPRTKTCSTCGGAGNIALNTGTISCPICGGDGEVPDDQELRLLTEPVTLRARSGSSGSSSSSNNVYDHAIATQALCKALERTPAAVLRGAAEAAKRTVLRAQNPYGAWRYSSPPDGDNDTSVTVWMVLALAAAREAGLSVAQDPLTNAMTWVDQMTNASNGRTGYTDMGGNPMRDRPLEAQFPPEYSEAMTAAGVLVRLISGSTAAEDQMIEKGADLMDANRPRWDDSGHVDFYYWYLGTRALYQLGGPRWARWNEAIKEAVQDHQRMDESEDEFGSWDPVDPWGTSGGRIYSTAILALTLEAATGEPARRK